MFQTSTGILALLETRLVSTDGQAASGRPSRNVNSNCSPCWCCNSPRLLVAFIWVGVLKVPWISALWYFQKCIYSVIFLSNVNTINIFPLFFLCLTAFRFFTVLSVLSFICGKIWFIFRIYKFLRGVGNDNEL